LFLSSDVLLDLAFVFKHY